MRKFIPVTFLFTFLTSATFAQHIYYRSTHDLIPYRVGDLWGYKASWKDSIVVKPQYEDADLFSSVGLARVKKNGLFGFINRLGDLEIPCTYEYAGTFYAGQTSYPKEIACVGQDQYINRKGVLLLLGSEPEPDEEITSGYYLFPKSAMDYFTFSVDSNYQIIRKKTNVMDSMDVEFFDPFTKELVIKVNNKMGVIDINGNQIIPPIYNKIFKQAYFDEYHFSGLNGYFIEKNGLVGYIDFKNRIVISPNNKKIVRFDLNVAEVITQTGKKGFIDIKTGTQYFKE